MASKKKEKSKVKPRKIDFEKTFAGVLDPIKSEETKKEKKI